MPNPSKNLAPHQISFLIELLEAVERSGYKSEELHGLVKSNQFDDVLMDLRSLNLHFKNEEEDE